MLKPASAIMDEIAKVNNERTIREINLGEELFRFESKQQWINKAQSWFRNSGVQRWDYICLDEKGRVCNCGAHFSRAEEEGTYPIVCYLI